MENTTLNVDPNMDLVQFIRRRRKNSLQKVGVLLGKKIDNGVVVGWSLCSKQDEFSKERALEIAVGRIKKGLADMSKLENKPLPNSLQMEFICFEDRCRRYFKTNEISIT